jgi:RNA polymerase sigma-70 factor (ECF subfamily)
VRQEEFASVLDAAQAGGNWAWSRLYTELAGPVLGYLRTRGAADPEDVLGDVFLDVARNIGTFAGDFEGFRSWVFTIAHRRLIDERRARGRRPVDPVADPESQDVGEDPATIVEARILREDMVALFSALSPEQRDVLLLRVIGGLTIDEVAVIVGKSRGAVKALQRRGISALKKYLG